MDLNIMPIAGYRKSDPVKRPPEVRCLWRCEACRFDYDPDEFPQGSDRTLGILICRSCRELGREEAKRLREELARKRKLGLLPRRSCIVSDSAFRARVMKTLRRIAYKRFSKGRGVKGRMPEEHAVRLSRLPERIAAIVGKTYVVQGDAGQLADDEALGRIRDLLIELDPTLIERNKNKRLARK